MNIDPLSTSSSNLFRAHQPARESDTSASNPSAAAEQDRVSTELSSKVRARLAELPEIRPEVVERGRALLADPSYPSADIMRQIAGFITPFAEE